jgi:hypothetical protein
MEQELMLQNHLHKIISQESYPWQIVTQKNWLLLIAGRDAAELQS